MSKVAAVVVTYNRKELLLECIDALLSQSCSSAMDIVVVDNASTDGTADALKQLISDREICYLNTGSNIGGAGGFNYGMRYAVENGYDFVWAMDDDTIPTQTALEELLKFDQKNKNSYGFLSSLALWTDGKPNRMNLQKKAINKRIKSFNQTHIKIGVATFVSIFIPTKIIRTVGLPIKEFFIWADDIEYTSRISKLKPGYLITTSRVVHRTKDNKGNNIADDSKDRLQRYRYSYRNEMYIYRRADASTKIYCAARLLYHSARVITKGDNRKEKLGIIWGSTLKGLRFNPEIEYVE